MSNDPKFRIKGVNPTTQTIGGLHAKKRDSPDEPRDRKKTLLIL
jgi:hypothetical protein